MTRQAMGPPWIALSCWLFATLAHAQSGIYDWREATVLGPGVKHATLAAGLDRIDGVQIDTQTNGLRFHTTERCPDDVADTQETETRTTVEFVADTHVTGHPVLIAALILTPPLPSFRQDAGIQCHGW